MKRLVIAGGLLASAALLTGGLTGCGLTGIAGPTEQDSVSYEVAEKVTKLEVRNGSGDTEITETDRGTVKVDETIQWRGEKPTTEHTVNGDTLVIKYDCPRLVAGNCGVNYKIEVPKGLQVTTEAGSGDITLRALSGPLTVSSGSGTVDASGLTGKTVVAELGSGDIELEYAAAPDSAEVETGSGSVILRVPDEGYDVSADVGSGDTTVSVRDERNAPRKIKVSAGSGDVSVLPQ
ncbi:DUF4097 family beta strand repeat-containing protein [Nonomuraea harbinensis]|uniref:DUF4097 family beta strand repeat-containing protein n=1 Tax=Nonomuraea harbinensis TaxID=1286938 RepID=A0ABW1BTZ5_9ACTN|nr:DUF4097 family beta strand repeat-containing protein [Nonomuraea harbinensis]